MLLVRVTDNVERLFHDGRVLEQVHVVLSTDDQRSFLDKHVELWRVEPVLDSLVIQSGVFLSSVTEFMFTPETMRKTHNTSMKTQTVTLPCFLSIN